MFNLEMHGKIPHGTKKSSVALFLECLDGFVGKGRSSPLEGFEAGIKVHKRKLEVE